MSNPLRNFDGNAVPLWSAAVVITVAAALKLLNDQAGVREQCLALAELVLCAGVLIVSPSRPSFTLALLAVVFAGFVVWDLAAALHFKRSCGCFGVFQVSPAAVLTFDIAASATCVCHLALTGEHRPRRLARLGCN